jgi:hypothetical protein
VIVLVVLIAGVAVLRLTNAGGASDVGGVAPSTGPTAGAQSKVSVSPSAAEPLRLVAGAKAVDGVRVGYPRSPVGAVSAAIEYWVQLGSTLDSDRARRIGARVAARSWKNAAADLAQGPVNSRRQLGLPPNGPVPPGASINLGPVAYQVRDVKADSMTVLVLAYMVTTTPTTGTVSRLGVFPAPMRWDDGDWRIAVDERRTDYSSLQATPGTTQATAAGWLDFVR